jgi:hypothetical protein
MNIELTKKQTEALKPLFEIVKENQKDPGCIFAQIVQTDDGGSFMRAEFIENERAAKIQSILRGSGKIEPGTGFKVIPVS